MCIRDSRCIVVVGARKLALVWQVDAVRRRPVERPVLLAVTDHGTGRLQDLLGPIYGVPFLFLAWLDRRQAVDLLGVKHGRKENPRPLQLDGHPVSYTHLDVYKRQGACHFRAARKPPKIPVGRQGTRPK